MKKENQNEIQENIETLNDEIIEDQIIEEEAGPEVIEYHREMSLGKKITISMIVLVLIVGGGLLAYFLNQKGFFDQYLEEKVSIETLKGVKIDSGGTLTSSDEKDGKNGKKEANKKVEILALNGGGIGGSAGEMKKLLDENDYENVDADNASSTDYIGVTIFYKSDEFENDAKILKDIIDDKYDDVKLKKADSASQNTSEIVIVVGK